MSHVAGQENQASFEHDFLQPRTKKRLNRQFLYRCLDAVATAPLKCKQPKAALVQTILKPGISKYERIRVLILLFDCLLPGVARRLSSALYTCSHFPFAYKEVQPIGYGSGSSAFLMILEDGPVVVKIYRRSLGEPPECLLELANEFRRKHHVVSSWYDGSYPLVPPASFFILHGHILCCPSVGVLQPFLLGETKDLFCDFEEAELRQILSLDQNLRAEFCFFAHRTLKVVAQQRLCLDFIGHNNVTIVSNRGGCSLKIIDNGIFNLQKLIKTDPKTFHQVEVRLNRLRKQFNLFETI